GPLVCIANHPFGVLDGLIMGYLLSLRRGKDFKIFAHGVFQHTEDVGAYILPVMFDEDAETVRKNLSVRREALDYLNDGGAIGIFPSGQVATSLKPFGDAIDRQWGVYTGRLVMRSRATVVPIYFAGQNSRLFQLMARVNDLVRVGLLLRELAKSYKGGVDLVIGKPVEREEIEKREQNPKLLMEYLRRCTYSLATPPLDDLSYGWDFDKAYGKGRNT
ncbi:MAG: 1-acyl-sn-glycerol-3-phosphate acyltransferase, partial [Parvularculales bacterium]